MMKLSLKETNQVTIKLFSYQQGIKLEASKNINKSK